MNIFFECMHMLEFDKGWQDVWHGSLAPTWNNSWRMLIEIHEKRLWKFCNTKKVIRPKNILCKHMHPYRCSQINIWVWFRKRDLTQIVFIPTNHSPHQHLHLSHHSYLSSSLYPFFVILFEFPFLKYISFRMVDWKWASVYVCVCVQKRWWAEEVFIVCQRIALAKSVCQCDLYA